jgi:hypothetical protein
VAALLVFTAAILHVDSPDGPCDRADSLADEGLLSDAHKEYATALRDNPGEACAGEGLDDLIAAQCRRAATLVAASPADAKKAYVAIATAEPVRDAAVCARDGLTTLPAADTGAER